MYNLFGSEFSDRLKKIASESPRKRTHHNIHQDYDESVQKTTICLVRGTYIPPHFHRHADQKELFVLLSGSVKFMFFDGSGRVIESLILTTGDVVEVLPFAIHTVVTLSDCALVLEIKQGPFVADDCKVFLDWTVPENEPSAVSYAAWLESAKVGEAYGII